MTTSIRPAVPTAARCLLGLVGLVAFDAALTAQDPKKIPPDKEVAEKVDALEDIAKDRKFERDVEARGIIDVLIQKHDKGLNEKDQKSIVKALDKLLNKSKVRPPDQTQIYIAVAEALGRHGEDGAKVLEKAYDGKRFPDKPEWVPVREKLLINIGRTKDEDMVKFLVDEARRNPEAALMAAAGKALGHFDAADEKVRKKIVDGLLVKYGSLSETASQLGTNIEAQNAKDRLAAIVGPWNETLGKLTRQQFDTFREWQAWHNKHKNDKW